jgi:hypothetical protein
MGDMNAPIAHETPQRVATFAAQLKDALAKDTEQHEQQVAEEEKRHKKRLRGSPSGTARSKRAVRRPLRSWTGSA